MLPRLVPEISPLYAFCDVVVVVVVVVDRVVVGVVVGIGDSRSGVLVKLCICTFVFVTCSPFSPSQG